MSSINNIGDRANTGLPPRSARANSMRQCGSLQHLNSDADSNIAEEELNQSAHSPMLNHRHLQSSSPSLSDAKQTPDSLHESDQKKFF